MKKTILILALIIAFCTALKAQTYEVPQNVVLNKKEDYAAYEQEVIKTYDYLQATPWTEEKEKRNRATGFLMKWMQGNSYVQFRLNGRVTRLFDNKGPLLFIYIGSCAKYALQHKDKFDQNEMVTTALKAIMTKYSNEPTHTQSQDIENLIKIDKEGRLNKWISEEMNHS